MRLLFLYLNGDQQFQSLSNDKMAIFVVTQLKQLKSYFHCEFLYDVTSMKLLARNDAESKVCVAMKKKSRTAAP